MDDITLLTNKFIKEVYRISKVNNYKIRCNIDTIEELKTIIDVCSTWQYKDIKRRCNYCNKYVCDECNYNA